MSDDLEVFNFQLDQVKLALDLDPHNLELRKVQEDLEELIELTLSLQGQSSGNGNSKRKIGQELGSGLSQSIDHKDHEIDVRLKLQPIWKVGDIVAAKWSGNGKLYEATITAVSSKGATYDGDIVYSVVFAGYTSVELVKQLDTRPFDPKLVHQPKKFAEISKSVFADAARPQEKKIVATAPIITSNTGGATNSVSVFKTSGVPSVPLGDPELEGGSPSNAIKKRKRDPNAKAAKVAKRQAKLDQVEAEHKKSQQTWLQFASGSGKKKPSPASSLNPIPILNKKSMFSTPDNPNAKVGVIGSGRGMTDFGDRNKHKFDSY
jgi:survival-of-motor-neuron-related-splicing factor 30